MSIDNAEPARTCPEIVLSSSAQAWRVWSPRSHSQHAGWTSPSSNAARRSAARCGKSRVGPSLIDSGPTVFTMRWVFEELFAAAGQNFADHVCLRPLEVLARHAWDEHTRLDLFADEERTIEAIGDFAGATEADGYRAFCRDTKRIYDILEKPFLRASQPSMGGLIGADGFRGLDAAAADQSRSRRCGRRSGGTLPILDCSNCSGAMPPIAGRRLFWRPRP